MPHSLFVFNNFFYEKDSTEETHLQNNVLMRAHETGEPKMTQKIASSLYTPGYYNKKRLKAKEWVATNIQKWSQAQAEKKSAPGVTELPPSICFSREIGVGALEIADALAEILHFQVIDREIIEHMAIQANLTEKIIEFYNQLYPGKMNELLSTLTLDNTFIESDYARQLAKTVAVLSGMEPTIFVGRGTHLILPRHKILSVRLICSKNYRLNRLANLIDCSLEDLEKKIRILDTEQDDFFKTVYQKKAPKKEEFDLVIYRDFFDDAAKIARIIACAYEQRFGKSPA